MKKLGKVLGILGGLFVFSETFGIFGEVQALCAMSKIYPDEVEDLIDIHGDDSIDVGRYAKFKTKLISKIARFYID